MNFADVVFVVGDERFSAHKVILSTRCEFLAKLFSSNFSSFLIFDFKLF